MLPALWPLMTVAGQGLMHAVCQYQTVNMCSQERVYCGSHSTHSFQDFLRVCSDFWIHCTNTSNVAVGEFGNVNLHSGGEGGS